MKSFIYFTFIISLLNISGCQTISRTTDQVTDKALSMIGLVKKDKVPEINKKDVVDISKNTLEQIEKLKQNMPIGQWIYIENDLQGIYELQNKAENGQLLIMRLNCKNNIHKTSFAIQDPQGSTLLSSLDPESGNIQVLLDNKNYGNPFNLPQQKQLDSFKSALKQAKVIKIFNANTLYSFNNGQAQLLDQAVTCVS